MATLRLIHIEIDGAEQTYADIIRGAVGGLMAGSLVAGESLARPALLQPVRPDPPQIAAPEPVAEQPRRKAGRPKKAPAAKREAASATPALRQAPGGGDSIGQRILDALAKKPLSSMELSEHLKVQPQNIYATNSVLKGKGLIESRTDESDGTRRWCLAK